MVEQTTVHLLMRYSDHLNEGVNTIEAHQSVIQKRGSVWLSKGGKPLAKRHIVKMAGQIEQNNKTYLYMVRRVGRGYELYRGTIVALSRELPKGQDKLFPAYYRKTALVWNAGLWIHLDTLGPASRGELDKLALISSGSDAIHALMHSMAGFFLVRRRAAAPG